MAIHLRASLALALGLLSSLLVACAAPGDASPSPSDAASTPPRSFDSVPQSSASAGGAGGVPEEMLVAVVDQAASGAGVDPSEVEVMTAEAVTWSDGSLGCPEPGMSYTQALVPGYRVVVEIAGEQLSFHSDASGHFTFCEDPQPGAADR
jgi:hypothetical protein